MGINYYLKSRVSESRKNQLKELVDKEDWNVLKDSIPEDVHIGKASKGWQFIWNANDFNFFRPNETSLRNFLKTGIIEDENGKQYTADEFWELIKDSLYEGMTLEFFYKKNYVDRYVPPPNVNQSLLATVYRIFPDKYGEFKIDGLNFTNCWFR